MYMHTFASIYKHYFKIIVNKYKNILLRFLSFQTDLMCCYEYLCLANLPKLCDISSYSIVYTSIVSMRKLYDKGVSTVYYLVQYNGDQYVEAGVLGGEEGN